MKKIFSIIVFIIALLGCQNNQKTFENLSNEPKTSKLNNSEGEETSKDDQLETTLFKVIDAYSNQETKAINSFINKDLGIYIKYARGAYDNISHTPQLDFKNPIPEYLPYEKDYEFERKVNYESLPEFSCETEKWNKKEGIYCNTLQQNKELSELARFENELNEKSIHSEALINQIKRTEQKIHKVILIDKNDRVLIFWVTYQQNKWWLVAIDRFEACSA